MNDLWSTAARLRGALGVRAAFLPRRMHGNILITALRAGLCVLVAVGTFSAIGRADLAPYAALGCFTALYARDDSYARRSWVLALVGTLLTASVLLGGLSSLTGSAAALILTVSFIAAAGKYVADALVLGAPAGLMFVFAGGVAAYSPQTLSALPVEIATTAAAALFCWCAAMVGRLVHPLSPQRLVVSRALIAVAAHLDAGVDSSAGTRHAAHQAVLHAWSVLHDARSIRRTTALSHLEALTARAESLLRGTGSRLGDVRTSAELMELARRTRRSRLPDVLSSEAEHAELESRAAEQRNAHDRGPGRFAGLREALRPGSPTRMSVLRIFIASAIAGLACEALGMGHGYWAAVSAGSVLQSVNVTSTWHRTLQRGTGTIAGALLAAVIFSFDASPWQLILLVALCQFCAELVVMVNYGYAIVFVTPLTVALSQLAHPAPAGGLVVERLLATLLGAVIGVVVSILLVNRSNGTRLTEAVDACRRSVADLRARTGGPEPVGAARDQLARSVVALRTAHGLAQGEPWAARAPDDEVLAAEQEAYDLLGRSETQWNAPRTGASAPGP